MASACSAVEWVRRTRIYVVEGMLDAMVDVDKGGGTIGSERRQGGVL